jgi:23S rRNA pseudouridine1911/1915/1917 synthase
MVIQTDDDPPRVIAETDSYLVAYKPAGMHCAPANGRGADGATPSLFDWAAERRPELAAVKGRAKGEGGLVHRLDRDTRGLVLFAKSDEAFAVFERSSAAGSFVKEYEIKAVADGSGLDGSRPLLAWPGLFAPGSSVEPSDAIAAADPAARNWARSAGRARAQAAAGALPGLAIRSFFRPFGPGAARVAAALRPSPHKQWTDAAYETKVLSCRAELGANLASIEARVSLSRGFRHQIRAQFAWLGLPLVNDALYGDEAECVGGGDSRLGLVAVALSFPNPADGSTARYTLA